MRSLPDLSRWPTIAPDLSNIDEVHAFSQAHEPSAGFLKFFHWSMDKLCDPYVVFVDETVPEQIEEHLASDKPTALVMTHHSFFDPSNAAAAIRSQPSMRGFEGRTVTQARSDWFSTPGLDFMFALGGAWPVIREKEIRKHFAAQGLSEEEVNQRVAELRGSRKGDNGKLRDIELGMVGREHNPLRLVSYIEGERNRGDQTVVQPVRNAVKNVVEGIDNPEDMKIVGMAYDYGGSKILKRRYLTPTMAVDIMDAPTDPEEVNPQVQGFLQNCMDIAIANRPEGLRLSPLAKVGILGSALGATAVAGLAGR